MLLAIVKGGWVKRRDGEVMEAGSGLSFWHVPIIFLILINYRNFRKKKRVCLFNLKDSLSCKIKKE